MENFREREMNEKWKMTKKFNADDDGDDDEEVAIHRCQTEQRKQW